MEKILIYSTPTRLTSFTMKSRMDHENLETSMDWTWLDSMMR